MQYFRKGDANRTKPNQNYPHPSNLQLPCVE
jgi:hypothetical protein